MPSQRHHKRRVRQLRETVELKPEEPSAHNAGVQHGGGKKGLLHTIVKFAALGVIIIAIYGVITRRPLWEDAQTWHTTGQWPALFTNTLKPNEPNPDHASPKHTTGGRHQDSIEDGDD